MISRKPETVEQKFKRLRGAPRATYQFKWMKLIENLIATYNIRDPQLLGLPYTLDDFDAVEKWVVGLCSGLTEPECANRIEEEIRKHGEFYAWKDEANDIKEYIEHIEEKASEVRKWQRIFRLPVDIDEYTAEQLKELYENPEMDHDTVYRIIKNYVVSLGFPEDEAEEIARKTASVFDKIVEARNRHLATAEWTQIMNYAAYRVKLELEKRKKRSKNILEKWLEKMAKPISEGLFSEEELETLLMYKVEKAKASKNVREAEYRLATQFRGEQAIITPPATIYKFKDEPLWCKVKELEIKSPQGAKIVNVIDSCNQDVIIVKQKDNRIYYQAIRGVGR